MSIPWPFKRPSPGNVAARIRVKAKHVEEAKRLFRNEGFDAIYVEVCIDGDADFLFGKEVSDRLWNLATAIPREFYAKKGVILKVG